MPTLSLNSLIFQPELIAPPVERKSILLAHLAKGNVSFCHHLAFVAR
jgi:hypothetical protein